MLSTDGLSWWAPACSSLRAAELRISRCRLRPLVVCVRTQEWRVCARVCVRACVCVFVVVAAVGGENPVHVAGTPRPRAHRDGKVGRKTITIQEIGRVAVRLHTRASASAQAHKRCSAERAGVRRARACA